MKNTIQIITSLFAVTALSQATVVYEIIDGSGTLSDGNTYTVSGGATIDANNNYFLTGGNGNTGVTDTFTIEFNDAVDFSVFYTAGFDTSDDSAIFSNVSGHSFVANTGTWSYDAGETAATGLPVITDMTDLGASISGVSVTFDGTSAGAHQSGQTSDAQDWGSFDISGVTSVTWTVPAGSFAERVRFSAVTVPEPTSAALLGLGGLALLGRRKRA